MASVTNTSRTTHHINPDTATAKVLIEAITKDQAVAFEHDGETYSFIPRPLERRKTETENKIDLMNKRFNAAGIEFKKFRNSALAFYDGKEILATILSPHKRGNETTRSWNFNLRPREDGNRVYLFVLYKEGVKVPPVATFTEPEINALRESHHISPDGLMSLRFFEIDGQLYEQCGKSPRTCVQPNVDHADTILQDAITGEPNF